MKRNAIILAALLVLVPATVKAQFNETNNLFYFAQRAPQSNQLNPAFFPSTLYLQLPALNSLQLGLPLSISDIAKYDSVQGANIIDVNHILDVLGETGNDSRFRMGFDLNVVGLGLKIAGVFVDANIDKKITRVATYKFKVKDIPNPDLIIGIHKTGAANAARKDFTTGDIYVVAQKNQAFEFSVPKGSMKVQSFDLSVGSKQYPGIQGNKFTPDIQSAIKKASRGDNLVVTAKVLMPDGKPREIDWIVKLKN